MPSIGQLFVLIFSGNWIPLISILAGKFVNWHYTVDVGGPVEKLFRPDNNVTLLDDEEQIQDREFRSGLHALQAIVRQAANNGKRLRAYGSRWSLSNVAYDDEYLIETWGLNYYKIGLDENHVTAQYNRTRNRLVFVQAGVMNRHINAQMLQQNLQFYTSGEGDGQRVVGAVATGTHNSALSLGAYQDFVRGIHLVRPPIPPSRPNLPSSSMTPVYWKMMNCSMRRLWDSDVLESFTDS